MAPSRGIKSLTDSLLYRRAFSTSHRVQSGHNRWSKIKHDKGKNDAIKNRQRSVFAQEIATASKLYGPDPALNGRLAASIDKAKKEGFAKASIEAAIARGSGKSATGASLENVTVEGILPNNVAVICDCETDSRLRTLMTAKMALKNAGGSATPCAYLFQKRGRIAFERTEGIGVDEALEVALEAGALDVEDGDDGGIVVFTQPTETKAVGEAVSNALGLQVRTSEIIWSPNEDTKVGLPSEDAAEELASFVDDLLDKESTVQAISMNISQGSTSEGMWKDLQSRLSA